MNEININTSHLTELTELDLIALCQLSNIKSSELEILDIRNNSIVNLDFITKNTPFINLKYLLISQTDITDISNLIYLKNIKELYMNGLNLKDEKEAVKTLKFMNNLEILYCYNSFKIYKKSMLIKEFKNTKINII